MGTGERIATPVCALARNDKFGTFSAAGAGEPGPYGLCEERRAADDRPYSGRPMTAAAADDWKRKQLVLADAKPRRRPLLQELLS